MTELEEMLVQAPLYTQLNNNPNILGSKWYTSHNAAEIKIKDFPTGAKAVIRFNWRNQLILAIEKGDVLLKLEVLKAKRIKGFNEKFRTLALTKLSNIEFDTLIS